MPAVTVLVPCYNAASTIVPTLYSVLNQTVSDWEVLVADDGSTDETALRIAEVRRASRQGHKIARLALPHRGCAAATHAGIIRARSDIVTVLDADDLLYENALSIVLSNFERQTCYLWTRFRHATWENRHRAVAGWAKPLPDRLSLFETFRTTGWWGGSHQRAFRRSVYLSTPGLDQRWQTAVDLQTCLLFAEVRQPTRHVPEFSYFYRRHGIQMSATRREEQRSAHREMLHAWRVRNGG